MHSSQGRVTSVVNVNHTSLKRATRVFFASIIMTERSTYIHMIPETFSLTFQNGGFQFWSLACTYDLTLHLDRPRTRQGCSKVTQSQWGEPVIAGLRNGIVFHKLVFPALWTPLWAPWQRLNERKHTDSVGANSTSVIYRWHNFKVAHAGTQKRSDWNLVQR